MLPLPASAGVIWNIGAGIGYLALVAAVVLYLYPLRAHGVPHRRLFALSQHRRIGWIALYIAGLHAAILLAAQPLIGHYLLPSAPLYMLCGLAAFIALAVLVATGISARSALRRAASPEESPASGTAMPCSRRCCRRCSVHTSSAAANSSIDPRKSLPAAHFWHWRFSVRLSARMGPYPNSPAVHRGSLRHRGRRSAGVADADGWFSCAAACNGTARVAREFPA